MMKTSLSLLLTVSMMLFGLTAEADATISQVTSNGYADTAPHVKGNYLVWQGCVDGDWEIFLYNAITEETIQITDNDYDDVFPQTDGNYVVWQGFYEGEWDIFLWDGFEVLLISDAGAEDLSPQIADGYVVWATEPIGDDTFGPGEIILLDAVGWSYTVLSESVDPGNALDDTSPRIDSNVVIWVQTDDEDNTTSYMYEIATGIITENPTYVLEDTSQRDGNSTVYDRHDGHDRDIFVYNRGSRKHYQITSNGLQDTHSSIGGNYVAWAADEEIFLANLLSWITATGGTDVRQKNFIANWEAPPTGVDSYRLDVSTENDFSSYVPGYDDLDVGNTTSHTVTGLDADTTYYYRIRAVLGGSTGANSNSITVNTSAPRGGNISAILLLLLTSDEDSQSQVIIRQ
jgi:beta propeller repeat protein